MFVVGLTEIFVVVAPPGFQAYVVQPEASRVTLFPLQMVKEGEAVIVGEGMGVTFTVFESVPEQPLEVPVKV